MFLSDACTSWPYAAKKSAKKVTGNTSYIPRFYHSKTVRVE